MSLDFVLLVDYRGYFYSSVRGRDVSMDVGLVQQYFGEHGLDLEVKRFRDVDFRTQNYCDQVVLYQSSEDRDLFHKSYVEDIVLGLQLQGALLVPRFECFRAHHNKVFMEILRDLCTVDEIHSVQSRGFGTLEDFLACEVECPTVIKPSAGAMSKGVRLLTDKRHKRRLGEHVSRSVHLKDALKSFVKAVMRKGYTPTSNHRRKFVVQQFIPGLTHDYKVLVYGDRYYVLLRRNRKGDFRASGSGMFEWPGDLPAGLLDFARSLYVTFDVPFLSLDVGYDGEAFHAIEFQFLHFGSLTIERSTGYYVDGPDGWTRVEGRSVLEEEFARSVVNYARTLRPEWD